MQFTEEFSGRYVLSAAHTDCDYDTAMDFFARGGKSVTHILNATSPCLKRAPGILGAVFDSPGVFAEVICDGHHIVPAMLRIISRLIGDRVIVVSDSMRAPVCRTDFTISAELRLKSAAEEPITDQAAVLQALLLRLPANAVSLSAAEYRIQKYMTL